MAKVWAPPEHIKVPEFNESMVDGKFDPKKDEENVARFTSELREWCTSHAKGDLVGKVVSWGVADGRAVYMVYRQNPRLELIHLPIHDAYQLPEEQIRGMRVSDIRKRVQADQVWEQINKKSTDWWDDQPDGTIVHYNTGFGAWVRGRVQSAQMVPIALVGKWEPWDLPRRQVDGTISEGYHAKRVRSGEPLKPHSSNIWEASYKRRDGEPDPTTMDPIDLSVPDMTSTEEIIVAQYQELLGEESKISDQKQALQKAWREIHKE